MAVSIVIYRLEFKSMEMVKWLKDNGDYKLQMDYGIFVSIGAVCATVVALVFGIIDLCTIACC